MSLLVLVLVYTSFAFFLSVSNANRYVERGLPNVDWTSWEDAKQGSKMNQKPILTLFTKPWCEESKVLKESLRNSKTFVELSKSFNLVSVEEPEETMNEIGFFCTDGDYTPRAYFSHNNGHVDARVKSPGREELKFHYSDAQTLEEQMQRIIDNGFPVVEKEEL